MITVHGSTYPDAVAMTRRFATLADENARFGRSDDRVTEQQALLVWIESLVDAAYAKEVSTWDAHYRTIAMKEATP